MKPSECEGMRRTLSAVRGVLENNPDISKQVIEDTLDVLAGNRRAVPYADHGAIERPYTRKEVAALLGKSVETVAHYAQIGKLKRVMRTDSNRGVGYTAESVRALVEGRAK